MKKIILQRNKVLAEEQLSFFSGLSSKAAPVDICTYDGFYRHRSATVRCKNPSSPASSTTEEISSKELESYFLDCKVLTPLDDTESCKSLFIPEPQIPVPATYGRVNAVDSHSVIPAPSPASSHSDEFRFEQPAVSRHARTDWANQFKRADFGPEYGFRPRSRLPEYGSQGDGWSNIRKRKMRKVNLPKEPKERKRPGRKPGRNPSKLLAVTKPIRKLRAKVDSAINCVCLSGWDVGPQIECEQCGKWQHIFCVGVFGKDTEGYKCHVCNPSRELPVADSEEAYKAFTAYAMSLPLDDDAANPDPTLSEKKTECSAVARLVTPTQSPRKRGPKRKHSPDKHLYGLIPSRPVKIKKLSASIKLLKKRRSLLPESDKKDLLKLSTDFGVQPPLNGVHAERCETLCVEQLLIRSTVRACADEEKLHCASTIPKCLDDKSSQNSNNTAVIGSSLRNKENNENAGLDKLHKSD